MLFYLILRTAVALASSSLCKQALIVLGAKWLFRPIPKVGSTILKRIAILSDGRVPPEQASTFESRPALAVHDPNLHCLATLANSSLEVAHQALYSQEWIRLAVTRHPGERLLSFWHDKLHLKEPAYNPLNTSVQLSIKQSADGTCKFKDFIYFLDEQWDLLKHDGHLMPQTDLLEIDAINYSHIIDRNEISKILPIILENRIAASNIISIKKEFSTYNQTYKQRLSKKWMDAYSEREISILEKRYGSDIHNFEYKLPDRRGARIKTIISSDLDALVDPLQQIRDRNKQIAQLQVEILYLKTQLSETSNEITLPIIEPSGTWQTHNNPESGLSELYELLNKSLFKEVLDLSSNMKINNSSGEYFYILGVANHMLGNHVIALQNFEEAEVKGFQTPYLQFNRGNAYRAAGKTEDGLRVYREALATFPSFSECRHNLALGLMEIDNMQEAELELRKLLRDQPSYYQASFCLGNLLRDYRKPKEALEAFRLCLQFAPCYIDAWNNMGLTLGSLGKYEEAITSYRHALSIDSDFKPSRQNLAQALMRDRDHNNALMEFERLASLKLNEQDTVIAFQGRINCLLELDRYNDAIELANNSSDDSRVVLMARLHVIPVLYHSEKQLNQIRENYLNDLSQLYQILEGICETDLAWPMLYSHAWSLTNFYLAYQMGNDRRFQELYAGILDRILRPKLGNFMQKISCRKSSNKNPIKIGIISPHLKNHNGSIWALGWLEGIAHNPKFKIFSYNLGEDEDSGTFRFADLGTYRHLHLNPYNPESQLQKILDDKLDLLIFTDIGMHPASKITSVLQLAAVQVQGWGHPITSGSSTISYFWGSEGMDPEKNQLHYSEKLIRLPGIGLNYETPIATHDGRILFEKFNLPISRPLILSLQSTFKYVPRNDETYAEIALRNKDALILLVGHMGNNKIVERLLNRMKPHFQERDLNIEEHLHILPRLEHADYMGLFSIAHHAIDTIDWNGGNSSLQALSQNCPVVTLPTEFMRGRHTVAMLNELKLTELIASDRDSYVEISSKLLKERDFYNSIKKRIKARNHILFHDKRVPEAIMQYVDKIVYANAVL